MTETDEASRLLILPSLSLPQSTIHIHIFYLSFHHSIPPRKTVSNTTADIPSATNPLLTNLVANSESRTQAEPKSHPIQINGPPTCRKNVTLTVTVTVNGVPAAAVSPLASWLLLPRFRVPDRRRGSGDRAAIRGFRSRRLGGAGFGGNNETVR